MALTLRWPRQHQCVLQHPQTLPGRVQQHETAGLQHLDVKCVPRRRKIIWLKQVSMWCGPQACPHSSVEVRLRPPAIDLWSTHVPLPAEAALLFLLLGAVYLHRLPQVGGSRFRVCWAPCTCTTCRRWVVLGLGSAGRCVPAPPAAGGWI